MIACVFALGFSAMAACKKSSNTPSVTDNLTGSNWKINSIVLDTNRNGVQDAADYTLTDTSWAHETIKFNSNGTVITTQYGVASQATYLLMNNNTYMTVTDTTGGTTTTTSYYIQTLTSTAMVLKDTAAATSVFGCASWNNFGK